MTKPGKGGRKRIGSLYFSGKTWKVRVTMPDGSRPNFDLETSDTIEAQKRRKKLLQELDRGVPIQDATEIATAPTTFKEYAKKVNDERKAQGIVSASDEWQRLSDYAFKTIGHMHLSDIRPKHIREVLNGVLTNGRSTTTVRHVRKAMYKVFRMAVVDELVSKNVVAEVDAPERREVKKQRVALADEEFTQLWSHLVDACRTEMESEPTQTLPYHLKNKRSQAAADKWAPHVQACLDAGGDHIAYAKANKLRSDEMLFWLRRAIKEQGIRQQRAYAKLTPARELLMMTACARVLGGMRTSDINRWDYQMLDHPHFTRAIIPRGKTQSPQTLVIPEPLRPYLRDWWERSGRPTAGPVFPVLRGPRRGQPKADRGVSYAARLRAACKAAGLTRRELFHETRYTLPVDFHSLRGAFVTAGRRAGVPKELTMLLADHSDRSVHELYVRDDPAFHEIPEAMIPELPSLPPPGPIVVTHADPSCSAMTHDETSSAHRDSSRATVDSNHWPSAPEADDATRPDHRLTHPEPKGNGVDGSPWVAEERGGSEFRLVLPSGSSEPASAGDGSAAIVLTHQDPSQDGVTEGHSKDNAEPLRGLARVAALSSVAWDAAEATLLAEDLGLAAGGAR